MILSVEKKFIFIHVPKAAGTSIHGALSHFDAFHKLRRADAAARVRHAALLGLPAAAAEFRQHTSASAAIAVLGCGVFDSYYSFCFVRNPFDAAVSWFHYRLQNPHIHGHAQAHAARDFDTYVRTELDGPDAGRWIELQHRYVIDADGNIAVRFLGRLETLEADFAAVLTALGVAALPLDRFNQSTHAPWASLYTPATFAIVARLCARDAMLFGYPSDPAAYGVA